MSSAAATRWSQELQFWDFKELQANCMGLSPRGDVAVLGGKKCMGLVDVDVNPGTLLSRSDRSSKYDVACVSLSHASDGAVAVASNNIVELWRISEDHLDLKSVLRGHARAVTDIDWCSGEESRLASCSIDTYILIWDPRDARCQRRHSPAITFSAMNAASQVRWSPIRPEYLASAHEGDVRVWDVRQPSGPFQYIGAHSSKIHGIDWDPLDPNRIVTSSQDRSCKVFDIREPKTPEIVINTKYPAWRSKFVPCGNGIVTATVPARWLTNYRAGVTDSNSLVLWSLGSKNLQLPPAPVHTFMGHTDVILDFNWKRSFSSATTLSLSAGEEEDCWIVSWSKDHTLRFWGLDVQTEKLLDMDQLTDAGDDMSRSCRYSECSSSSTKSSLNATSLLEEFALINCRSEEVSVSEKNSDLRTCTIVMTKKPIGFTIKVDFPLGYPNGIGPSFEMTESQGMTEDFKNHVLAMLRNVAQKQIVKSKMCLEPAIRRLEALLKSVGAGTFPKLKKTPSSSAKLTENPAEAVPVAEEPGTENFQWKETTLTSLFHANFHDVSVPFPRTSGARFCGPGYLVCFGRPGMYKSYSGLTIASAPSEISIERGAGEANSSAMSTSKAAKSKSRKAFGVGIPVAVTAAAQGQTPRSLSALGGFMPASDFDPSVPVYTRRGSTRRRSPACVYYDTPVQIHQARKLKSKSGDSTGEGADRRKTGDGKMEADVAEFSGRMAGTVVHVFDISRLLPASRDLAKRYVVEPADPIGACVHNSVVCEEYGYMSLARSWKLAAQIASSACRIPNSPFEVQLDDLPTGRKLLESMIDYYAGKMKDVQMAAALCCVFSSGKHRIMKSGDSPVKRRTLPKVLNQSSSYNTIHDPTGNSTLGYYGARQCRSNSWTEDNRIKLCSPGEWNLSMEPLHEQKPIHETPCSCQMSHNHSPTSRGAHGLLSPNRYDDWDDFKRAYAHVLGCWDLLAARVRVLKLIEKTRDPRDIQGEMWSAKLHCHCRKDVGTKLCASCQRRGIVCSICQIGVKGSSIFCFVCGHGGHILHMADWFESFQFCPSGCGCHCSVEMEKYFSPIISTIS